MSFLTQSIKLVRWLAHAYQLFMNMKRSKSATNPQTDRTKPRTETLFNLNTLNTDRGPPLLNVRYSCAAFRVLISFRASTEALSELINYQRVGTMRTHTHTHTHRQGVYACTLPDMLQVFCPSTVEARTFSGQGGRSLLKVGSNSIFQGPCTLQLPPPTCNG